MMENDVDHTPEEDGTPASPARPGPSALAAGGEDVAALVTRLRSLMARAAPGPWVSLRRTPQSGSDRITEPVSYWAIDAGPRAVAVDRGHLIHADDMDAIAALWNAAPLLLDLAEDAARRDAETSDAETSDAARGRAERTDEPA